MFDHYFRHKQYSVKGTRTKHWSSKHGYENNFHMDDYPFRSFTNNKEHELKFRLQINRQDLINSNEAINGFPVSLNFIFFMKTLKILMNFHKIYVGHPMDYPYHMEKRVFVPLNVQFTLNIVPDMILVNENLKQYSMKNRQCLIDKSEWDYMKIFRVKFCILFIFRIFNIFNFTFKEYSSSNCYLECVAKKSFDYCECNQFFVPGKFPVFGINQTKTLTTQL